MKFPTTVAAIVLSALVAGSFAASSDEDSSKISTFKGRYQGTMLLSVGGSTISGPTQGGISASNRKEKGTIQLNTTLDAGGTPLPWAETFFIRKRTFSYVLSINGTTVTGSGSAHIGKQRLAYNGSVASGGSNFSINGTMRKSKRKLRISEALSGNGTTFLINYSLRQRK